LVGNSQAKIDATFNDLMRKYKSRGYEIPDFSMKNNLFEVDPLLLKEEALHEYYDHQTKEVLDSDLNVKFLENVNIAVIKKLTNNEKLHNSESIEEENPQSNSNVEEEHLQNLNSTYQNNKAEFDEVRKEIKKTLHHNKLIKSYFCFKYDKEMKNLLNENIVPENSNIGEALPSNLCNFILNKIS